jgi:hypothetical protein
VISQGKLKPLLWDGISYNGYNVSILKNCPLNETIWQYPIDDNRRHERTRRDFFIGIGLTSGFGRNVYKLTKNQSGLK